MPLTWTGLLKVYVGKVGFGGVGVVACFEMLGFLGVLGFPDSVLSERFPEHETRHIEVEIARTANK